MIILIEITVGGMSMIFINIIAVRSISVIKKYINRGGAGIWSGYRPYAYLHIMKKLKSISYILILRRSGQLLYFLRLL